MYPAQPLPGGNDVRTQDMDGCSEPSEFGFVPAYVNRLPHNEGGPYRGTSPKAKRIIGKV